MRYGLGDIEYEDLSAFETLDVRNLRRRSNAAFPKVLMAASAVQDFCCRPLYNIEASSRGIPVSLASFISCHSVEKTWIDLKSQDFKQHTTYILTLYE